MEPFVIGWLLLAGPLWALIGGIMVPRVYAERGPDNQQSMLAGVLSGFTLGPLGVGYLWQRPRQLGAGLFVTLGIIGMFLVAQVVVRVNTTALLWTWLLLAGPLWAVLGGIFIPRRYRDAGLVDEGTTVAGVLGGFAAGPLVLVPVWFQLPDVRNRAWVGTLTAIGVLELYTVFAVTNPDNVCVAMPFAPTYFTQQVINGLTIGVIYAITAVGLTLIYSVQGIVNFAHGQIYMVGGFFSYYFLLWTQRWMIGQGLVGEEFILNPLWGIPVAGVLSFLLGAAFEMLFIRPMHKGAIERPAEYAILITFGFGFFLEYTTLAMVGPFPQRAEGFTDIRRVSLAGFELDGDAVFGPFTVLADRGVAMFVGLALLFFLLWFLQRTWAGRALRAVSQDKDAAAVTGVNPLGMNTFAFALGSMLAGMSGAALVPIFAWVAWVGAESAVRAYVVVVLGGLGSVPGALFGGLIVGVVESVGAGCYPDPSRGAAYKEAFALAIFALMLLLRPNGLFGQKE
jgi:branched-chain amino acid transport system permease protein